MASSTESMHLQSTVDGVMDFAHIVNVHQRRIVAIACHMLGNLEDARDIAQEAFVRLWRHRNTSLDGQALTGLLTRIVINLCIDRLRERKRRRFLFLDVEETSITASCPADNPVLEIENREFAAALAHASSRLKPRQKAIFVLRDMEGFSVRETAQIIGCSENSVLVNLHKARKNLRKWLAPYLQS